MISVFLVDDEELILQGMRRIIPWQKYGFQIVGDADDGSTAIERIAEKKVDIVITDLKMMLTDGISLCTTLKEKFPLTEVIIVTGFDQFNLVKQALRAGASDYILKPIDTNELIQALKKARETIEENETAICMPFLNPLVSALENDSNTDIAKTTETMKEFLINRNLWEKYGATLVKRMICLIAERLNIPADEQFLSSVFETPEKAEDEFNKLIYKIGAAKFRSNELNVVERVKYYIDSHYAEDISLNSIANELYVNSSYISFLFKKETGENYTAYLMNVRLKHAKKLLRETDFSIEEISARTGFGNSKYFSKVFKNIVGVQPRQYRREAENEQF